MKRKQNLKHFVTWRTDGLKPMTYDEALAQAAERANGRDCLKGKVYILEITGVAKPLPPPVEIVPYEEGM